MYHIATLHLYVNSIYYRRLLLLIDLFDYAVLNLICQQEDRTDRTLSFSVLSYFILKYDKIVKCIKLWTDNY